MGCPRQTALCARPSALPRALVVQVESPAYPSGTLESETSGQLKLTPRADCAEYSAYVVGEITRCIAEDGVSVPSEAKRALRISRDSKIRMVEQIVGFRAKRDLRTFRQLEGLLQRQIEFRECGADQDIAPSIAKLTGGCQRKCPRIKPA
jgi:hypothetical protein